jgi:hypothetical protein
VDPEPLTPDEAPAQTLSRDKSTDASADRVNAPASVEPAPPITVTVAPSHPSHWFSILALIRAIMAAEQPILLHIVPPKGQTAIAASTAGIDAVLAAGQQQPQ